VKNLPYSDLELLGPRIEQIAAACALAIGPGFCLRQKRIGGLWVSLPWRFGYYPEDLANANSLPFFSAPPPPQRQTSPDIHRI
jgi:hypothetical protein